MLRISKSGFGCKVKRKSLVDRLLVRIHFIIVMIRWTGLAPRELKFRFPGSLTATFLCKVKVRGEGAGVTFPGCFGFQTEDLDDRCRSRVRIQRFSLLHDVEGFGMRVRVHGKE